MSIVLFCRRTFSMVFINLGAGWRNPEPHLDVVHLNMSSLHVCLMNLFLCSISSGLTCSGQPPSTWLTEETSILVVWGRVSSVLPCPPAHHSVHIRVRHGGVGALRLVVGLGHDVLPPCLRLRHHLVLHLRPGGQREGRSPR